MLAMDERRARAGLLTLVCLGLAAWAAAARAEPAPAQDPAEVARVAEEFLRQQASALPGQPVIALELPQLDRYPACQSLGAFVPGGAQLRPRMTIGVRCAAPQPWTAYVQASLAVRGQYYVAAHAIRSGQTVRADALAARDGDLVTLPPGTVVDPAQAIGRIASQRISAGRPLRASALRDARSVLRGQTVRVLARGSGFVVSSEGQAMANAAPGGTVQVKMASGQVVSGVVRDAGTVEVPL